MPSASDGVFPFLLESNYRYEIIEPRYYGATEYRDFPVRLSLPVPAGACAADEPMELREGSRSPNAKCRVGSLSPKPDVSGSPSPMNRAWGPFGVPGDAGRIVPAVIAPRLRWPDGSVRVWDVWFPANLRRTEKHMYSLQRGQGRAQLPERALREPSAVSLSVVLGDGAELRKVVELPPLPTGGDALACWERESPFELGPAGAPAAFRGAIVRKTWSWYAGAEFSIRLIHVAAPEVMEVKEVRLEFDLPGRGPCRYAVWQSTITAGTPRLAAGTMPLTVRADADGVHVSDVAQLGLIQTDFAPYERGSYLESVDNWAGMADESAAWVLVVPEAAERWPKGWQVDGRHVTVELHPAWAAPLQWRQGMALFQRFCLARLPPDSSPEAMMEEGRRWLRPPLVTIDPDSYRAADWRIPFRYQPGRFPRTEFIIRETWTFAWTRGTFDWGDDVSGGRTRNHEYDFIACAAKEFARTGRTELWKLCRAAAEHMMHTDFVARSDDPWKEGGVPAHCLGHTTGSAYPSHMWTEGLLLYHQLSGDPYALKVAMRVGDFFLKYVRERFQVVQGTAREMGWTLVALAALYDVTREPRYLEGAGKIVDFYLARGVERFFPTDATFAVGVAVIGLDRVRPFHRDHDIRRFILGVLDWIMEHRCDEVGLFDYWHDSERKAFTWIQTHLPEALNIGYRLSGDLKYLKAAWRLFQIHLGGAALTVQNKFSPSDSGYAGGYHISWTMGCLQSFAEKGWLDQVQYLEPE